MRYYSNKIRQFVKEKYNRELGLNIKYYSDFDASRLMKLIDKTLLINVIRLEGLCVEIEECTLLSASIYLFTYLSLIGFEDNEIKDICKRNFPELYLYLLKVVKKRLPSTHL
ncbi:MULTISPECIES: hypothetical protein [Sulfolobaceae]|uniref:hypothetical protein n=1 Tax=Sulfolobaceae TaxID=118883 RepID=UPI001EE98211|nr:MULTISPECIES: hypothetical protein [unclassified Sulfolobus]